MRLSVAANGRAPAGEVLALARACDSLPVAEMWITEDYFERGAFAVAGAVLAATQRVRVGIGVVNPWTRHPVLTAMEAAALAEIGPGRVLLGLGASNARWMGEQLGLPFERPLSHLLGSVAIIRTALAGRPVDQEWCGQRLAARLAFTPPGPIPIALGVKGERALQAGARAADVLLLSALSSPDYVRWVRTVVGPEPRLDVLAGVSLDDDAPRARDRIRPFVATFLGVHGDQPITRVAGIGPDLAAQLRAGWVSGAPRTDLVSDEMLTRFCLAGNDKDVRAGLAAFADAGADSLVVQNRGAGDVAQVLTRISRLLG
ncbi:MAG TPA: LLM class flavin-dependent oxidoreductase [Streptosporangiaceae bacterium]|nr:LLM class flavin-dependent oxidoreductase [Streptosporangiaceae bacterium]